MASIEGNPFEENFGVKPLDSEVLPGLSHIESFPDEKLEARLFTKPILTNEITVSELIALIDNSDLFPFTSGCQIDFLRRFALAGSRTVPTSCLKSDPSTMDWNIFEKDGSNEQEKEERNADLDIVQRKRIFFEELLSNQLIIRTVSGNIQASLGENSSIMMMGISDSQQFPLDMLGARLALNSTRVLIPILERRGDVDQPINDDPNLQYLIQFLYQLRFMGKGVYVDITSSFEFMQALADQGFTFARISGLRSDNLNNNFGIYGYPLLRNENELQSSKGILTHEQKTDLYRAVLVVT